MPAETAVRFWEYIDTAQFDELGSIMSKDAVVWCPNTKEVYRSAKAFIDFNKAYPGRWFADVEKAVIAQGEAITVSKVYDERGTSFYCISFFKFADGLISEIIQYWSENSDPPEWRDSTGLAENY